MAQYQVRTWAGWHHHITLCLIATWFLVREGRRGKKWTPAITVPQLRQRFAQILRGALGCDTPAHIRRECERWLERNKLAKLYHQNARKRLPRREFNPREYSRQ